MACHTLTECAKLANVSRRTIQRYIKSGKLSCKKNEHGNPEIETSELIRVFGNVSHPVTDEMSHLVTPPQNELSVLIEQAVKKATQPLIQEIKELREEMKSVLLLTYQSEESEQEKTVSPKPTKSANSELDDIPNLSDYFNNK